MQVWLKRDNALNLPASNPHCNGINDKEWKEKLLSYRTSKFDSTYENSLNSPAINPQCIGIRNKARQRKIKNEQDWYM